MRTTNLNYLKGICENDQRFMKEMIVTFLELTPMLLAQMKILARESKWGELAKTAHQLRPSLQFMGMEPARKKVKELEDLCGSNPESARVASYIEFLEKDCHKAFSELSLAIKNGFVAA